MSTIAITGATGYLGSVFTEHLAGLGHTVIALVRSPTAGAENLQRPFTLGDPVASCSFDGVDALVHCAYDMTLTDASEVQRVNVIGTERLLDAAVGRGVARIILLSSMSAYEGIRRSTGGRNWRARRPV